MKPVVFLGMSLSLSEARKILDADYRPPVKRGDLPGLDDGVGLVGIIDGVFMNDCSVGHREIIALLKRGATVVGGGSMGALRASELSDLGMIGVGKIYSMYLNGEIEGDDEVALVFNPETNDPLSEPLVNIRATLALAVEKGVLETDISNQILDRVGAEFYPKRSFSRTVDIARGILDPITYREFADFVGNSSVDLKRRDAIAVLQEIEKIRKNDFPENRKKSKKLKNINPG
jgi:TfuA protein